MHSIANMYEKQPLFPRTENKKNDIDTDRSKVEQNTDFVTCCIFSLLNQGCNFSSNMLQK